MTNRIQTLLCGILGLASLACSPSSLVEMESPSNVVDPSVVTTASGALQLYQQAVGVFAVSYGGVVPGGLGGGHIALTGMFTDEMMSRSGGSSVDSRSREDFSGINGVYQRPRVTARQAREALQRYFPGGAPALRGRLHAMEGFVLLFIAEAYCSGFPITEIPLVGSPILSRGASTQELFERAIAQFDSAITLSTDTLRFVHLGQVGKARALLGLGKFEEARSIARSVPQDYVYEVEYGATGAQINNFGSNSRYVQISDNEGGSPIVWSSDPRTAVVTVSVSGVNRKITAKYSRTSSGTLDPTVSAPATPIRLADGLEAKLIEAEADLALGQPSWLSILRTLREMCIGTALCAPIPGLTLDNLPASALNDPGNAQGRLDLLMQERAMWLFATGHRQGDLRRLVRVYRRAPETTWPRGTYVNTASTENGSTYADRYVFNYGLDGDNAVYEGCFSLDPRS